MGRGTTCPHTVRLPGASYPYFAGSGYLCVNGNVFLWIFFLEVLFSYSSFVPPRLHYFFQRTWVVFFFFLWQLKGRGGALGGKECTQRCWILGADARCFAEIPGNASSFAAGSLCHCPRPRTHIPQCHHPSMSPHIVREHLAGDMGCSVTDMAYGVKASKPCHLLALSLAFTKQHARLCLLHTTHGSMHTRT